MKIIFEGSEDFEAFGKAEKYCRVAGYSVGSMQGDDPIGIIRGDVLIAKWRNLSKADKAILDGVITGDKRSGPVTVELYTEPAACSDETIERSR